MSRIKMNDKIITQQVNELVAKKENMSETYREIVKLEEAIRTVKKYKSVQEAETYLTELEKDTKSRREQINTALKFLQDKCPHNRTQSEYHNDVVCLICGKIW